MHGGQGDIVRYQGGYGHFPDPGITLRQLRYGPLQRLLGIGHQVQESLDVGLHDPFQVIAHAHIENKARLLRCSPTKAVLEQVQQDPGFEVFIKALFQPQFLGPFAVVALVLHVDARLGHLNLIQGLHSLEFDVAGAGEPGADYSLGHLGVWSRRHPDGGFQQLPVAANPERVIFGRREKLFAVNSEYVALFLIGQGPVHQP